MIMATGTVTAMAEPARPVREFAGAAPAPGGDTLSPAALLRLLAWLSPSFPVGAYTYSHGLEWAIADGTVTTPSELQAWLFEILRHGAGRSDAILFTHAWRAAEAGDAAALLDLAAVAAAFQPTRERHLEATAQGRAFMTGVLAAWPDDRLSALAAPLAGHPLAYAVAVATAAAATKVPLNAALTAFLGAFVANVVSAGVRAIPIGQTDGQRIVAAAGPVIETIVAEATVAPLDEIGGVALRADIASMKHETQYTRLFRS
jgi:urease accessory protein